MKHFGTEEWADLARGVASAEAAARMEGHIRECVACREKLDWCKTMVEISKREPAYEPTDQAVRSAKALAALITHERPTLATLIFDSFRQPALAGVRAAMASAQQVVFTSGDVVVDLKLDPIPGSDRTSILGQIMHKHDRYGIGYVPLALRMGAQQIAKTFANRFGEFQFETKLSGETVLSVVLPDSGVIEVPLGQTKEKAT